LVLKRAKAAKQADDRACNQKIANIYCMAAASFDRIGALSTPGASGRAFQRTEASFYFEGAAGFTSGAFPSAGYEFPVPHSAA